MILVNPLFLQLLPPPTHCRDKNRCFALRIGDRLRRDTCFEWIAASYCRVAARPRRSAHVGKGRWLPSDWFAWSGPPPPSTRDLGRDGVVRRWGREGGAGTLGRGKRGKGEREGGGGGEEGGGGKRGWSGEEGGAGRLGRGKRVKGERESGGGKSVEREEGEGIRERGEGGKRGERGKRGEGEGGRMSAGWWRRNGGRKQ